MSTQPSLALRGGTATDALLLLGAAMIVHTDTREKEIHSKIGERLPRMDHAFG